MGDVALANDDVALATTLIMSMLDDPLPTGKSSSLQADGDVAAATCADGRAAGRQHEGQPQIDSDAEGGAAAAAADALAHERPAAAQSEDVLDDAEAHVSL